MKTKIDALLADLSSDVKSGGAGRQMKSEEWRVNNEIRLIRVIRCKNQLLKVL